MKQVTAMDSETTVLLQAWQHGDKAKADVLFERLYDELHRLAGQIVRGKNSKDTISPTGLVAEAYLRLEQSETLAINDRQHFFALAGRVMRRIIIDRAKHIHTDRQGGEAQRCEVNEHLQSFDRSPEDMIALNEALEHLSGVHPRLVLVAELLVFGSLRLVEVAAVLGVSRKTVQRDIDEIGDQLKRLGYAAKL